MNAGDPGAKAEELKLEINEALREASHAKDLDEKAILRKLTLKHVDRDQLAPHQTAFVETARGGVASSRQWLLARVE